MPIPRPKLTLRRPNWISEAAWRVIGVVVALVVFAAIFGLLLWPLTALWRYD
jgi:anti-sigma-K factor RskA